VYNLSAVSFLPPLPTFARLTLLATRLASLMTVAVLLLAAFGLGYQSVGSIPPESESAQITLEHGDDSGDPLAGSLTQAFTPVPEEDETGGEPHIPSLVPHLIEPSAGPAPRVGSPMAGHAGSLHRPPWV